MRLKIFVLCVVTTNLFSCASADLVQPAGGAASSYAPSNESQRPGVVKYLNDGADFVIKSRREDAYKKMYDSCGGKYKIVSEGPSVEGGAMMPVGSAYMFMQSNYWYISFVCEK